MSEDRYRDLLVELTTEPGVAPSRNGELPGVKVGTKVFAMWATSNGTLVVKLPEDRVNELTEAGQGHPHRMGARVLREWFSVAPDSTLDWHEIATEARDYVAAGS